MNWYKQWKLKRTKKLYLRRKVLTTHIKIWDLEFMLEQLKETREGFRREYDRIRETVDAAKRRWFSEKYTFYYSATGDTVDVMNISLTYEDLERLPEKPKEPWRFHKVSKPNPDEKICENMQKVWEKLEPDLEQLKKQMDSIDERIKKSYQQEGDGGVLSSIEGYRTVISLLKKYIKIL